MTLLREDIDQFGKHSCLGYGPVLINLVFLSKEESNIIIFIGICGAFFFSISMVNHNLASLKIFIFNHVYLKNHTNSE